MIRLEKDLFYKESASFLTDTGSHLNLIKQEGLVSNFAVNTNMTYHLTGFCPGMICTRGKVLITVRDIPINFQVVSNDFPIRQTGILGILFLEKPEVTLTFRDKLPLIARFGVQILMSDPDVRSAADGQQILLSAWHTQQRHLRARITKLFPTRDVTWPSLHTNTNVALLL